MRENFFFQISYKGKTFRLALGNENTILGILIILKYKNYFYVNKNILKHKRIYTKKFLKTFYKIYKNKLQNLKKCSKSFKITFSNEGLEIISEDKEKIYKFLKANKTFINYEVKNVLFNRIAEISRLNQV